MESVEKSLIMFADEEQFNRLNATEFGSQIMDICKKLRKLDKNTRYELLNSLYFNKRSNGYSKTLPISRIF